MNCLNVRGFNLHGMRDPRWTIYDEVEQYRAVIKLEKQDRLVREYETEKTKRRDEKLLSDLRYQVKCKQNNLRHALEANQRSVWSTLSDHSHLQRAFGYKTSDVVIAHLQKENDLKRKKLDLLNYRKQKIMQKYQDIISKASIMEDKILIERANMKSKMEMKKQTVCLQIQNSNMRKLAAENIRSAYSSILNQLKKDQVYFDCVLDTLTKDRSEQSAMMLAVTGMGQIVTEYTDDLKTECETIETSIKANMKIREESLEIYRNLKLKLEKGLSKLAPIGDQYWPKSDSMITTVDIGKELDKMEEIFHSITTIVGVVEIDDIQYRMFRQQILSERIQRKINVLWEAKERLRKYSNNIEFFLGLIKHTYNEDEIAHLEKKRNLLRQIRKQQERRQKIIDENATCRQLLQSIRAQFNHMQSLTKIVRWNNESKDSTLPIINPELLYKRSRLSEITKNLIGLNKLPKTMKDTGEVYGEVKKKLEILYNAFDPSGKLTRVVERFFDKSSRQEYDEDENIEIDLLQGVVFEDTHIHTYKSMKALSKQVVEDNTVDELTLIAAQVKAKMKPGAAFRKIFLEEKIKRKRNTCAL